MKEEKGSGTITVFILCRRFLPLSKTNPSLLSSQMPNISLGFLTSCHRAMPRLGHARSLSDPTRMHITHIQYHSSS